MVSIQTALETINLEKYAESFNNSGITSLDELLALSVDQLTTLMNGIGMLKGHTFKLKKFVDDTRQRGFNPNPPAPTTIIPPQPAQVAAKDPPVFNGNGQAQANPSPSKSAPKNETPEAINPSLLSNQMDSLTKQLNGIVTLQDQVSNTLKAIMEVDLSKYKQAIEEMEQIQASIKAHLEKPEVEKDVEMQA
ncbi:unnamed protein product [Blepharisma stoltei]|uniref:SAM domain-containing protein n=1 Tax=Blepharisma stoltei TaxID=1481888 RepID=A0AAU9JIX6_9CILI|nr:unnamed protein product [Blepharisma stoltei]